MEIKSLVVNDKEICRFSEVIELKNEVFLFEILREGETILLIDNEPVSVVWHENGPSSVHFYALAGISIDKKIQKKLDDFENQVQGEVLADDGFYTLFELYKPLLKSGQYRLFYTSPHTYEITNYFSNNRRFRPFGLIIPQKKEHVRPSLYLDEGVFMFTQSIDTINHDRIEFYKEQILNGKSPTIITLGMQPKDESVEDVYSQFVDSYPQFIIDGHHKALAYHSINSDKINKGLPYKILVPAIFSIVRVPENGKEDELSEIEREELLKKILSDEETAELIEFYSNW